MSDEPERLQALEQSLADALERLEDLEGSMSSLAKALRRDLRKEVRRLGVQLAASIDMNGELVGERVDGLTRTLRIAAAIAMVLTGLGALFGPTLAVLLS